MGQSDNKQFPTLEEDLHTAMRQWNTGIQEDTPLLYLYLLRKTVRQQEGNLRAAIQLLLNQALSVLDNLNGVGAQLLRARFLDKEPVRILANRSNMAESTLYGMQQDAFQHLANIVRKMEAAARAEQRTVVGERLGAPAYQQLVGVDEYLRHLLLHLGSSSPPYLLSIEGIGGLGKTSLADALVRCAVEENFFDYVGWVTARQQYLALDGAVEQVTQSALTAEVLLTELARQLLPDLVITSELTLTKLTSILESHLRTYPHLIVIDNLETVTDVRQLLPTLRRLANPTKFILTSRERLAAEPNIYHFSLPELTQAAALQLIRQEAVNSNLSLLAESPDDELIRIFSAVGGNPLALRLVVGQLHMSSIDTVLTGLAEVHGQTVENLYMFIYRWAWDRLSALSRSILAIMPLTSLNGEALTFLGHVTALSQGELQTGLHDLINLNLVNVYGDIYNRRYGIHGLTRTFLHKQVVLWQ